MKQSYVTASRLSSLPPVTHRISPPLPLRTSSVSSRTLHQARWDLFFFFFFMELF